MPAPIFKYQFIKTAIDKAIKGDVGDFTLAEFPFKYKDESQSITVPTLFCYVRRTENIEQAYVKVASIRYVFHKEKGWITPEDEDLNPYIKQGKIIPYNEHLIEILINEILKPKNIDHIIKPKTDQTATLAVEAKNEIPKNAVPKQETEEEKKEKNKIKETQFTGLCNSLKQILPTNSVFSIWKKSNTEIASEAIRAAILKQTSGINDNNAYDKLKEVYKVTLNQINHLYTNAKSADETTFATKLQEILTLFPFILENVQQDIQNKPEQRQALNYPHK